MIYLVVGAKVLEELLGVASVMKNNPIPTIPGHTALQRLLELIALLGFGYCQCIFGERAALTTRTRGLQ